MILPVWLLQRARGPHSFAKAWEVHLADAAALVNSVNTDNALIPIHSAQMPAVI